MYQLAPLTFNILVISVLSGLTIIFVTVPAPARYLKHTHLVGVMILIHHRPFYGREYQEGRHMLAPDIEIFRKGLMIKLEEYECCEADDGYMFTDPERLEVMQRVRSRQETANKRFENLAILSQNSAVVAASTATPFGP